MERRISGVSYMCWMGFHNVLWVLYARLISLFFWFSLLVFSFVSLFPATTPRATTPHLYPTGYHALTTTARLSRLCIYPGYHAIVYFYYLVNTQSYHAPPHT